MLLLVPVQMTWEAVSGTDNVSDNKKVTAVDANDNPTQWQWMQGKGSRIFADRRVRQIPQRIAISVSFTSKRQRMCLRTTRYS